MKAIGFPSCREADCPRAGDSFRGCRRISVGTDDFRRRKSSRRPLIATGEAKIVKTFRSSVMDPQSAMSMLTFLRKHQPLTPVSPCLPTNLPLVCDTIPQLPLTPPEAEAQSVTVADEEAIQTALHVLSTERDALTHLEQLYHSDRVAQGGFVNAVDIITKTVRSRAKLVVCGVGKSGKIGEKVVATMNSLGIRSIFLHPTEALHGDLGTIGPVSLALPRWAAGAELLGRMIPSS